MGNSISGKVNGRNRGHISVMLHIALVMMVIVFGAMGCGKQQEELPVDHTKLIEVVRSGDKMVFSQMSVKKTMKSERKAWYKVGKRIAVYSYDTYLRAYIDMTEIGADDIVFDDRAKTVSVKLPKVKTELDGREMELHKEYENIGLLRSHLDSKERAEMKEQANADLLRELDEDPVFMRKLRDTAERKAREYFQDLFAANGYTATITFGN